MDRSRTSSFLLLLALVMVTVAAAHRQGPGFLYTRSRKRCTSQYWSSEREEWPRMVPKYSTLSNVFGSGVMERYRANMTLLEASAIEENEQGYDVEFLGLLRESTAALVNSYARRGYPYASWEVKTLVIQALVSRKAAAYQAHQFFQANSNCG